MTPDPRTRAPQVWVPDVTGRLVEELVGLATVEEGEILAWVRRHGFVGIRARQDERFETVEEIRLACGRLGQAWALASLLRRGSSAPLVRPPGAHCPGWCEPCGKDGTSIRPRWSRRISYKPQRRSSRVPEQSSPAGRPGRSSHLPEGQPASPALNWRGLSGWSGSQPTCPSPRWRSVYSSRTCASRCCEITSSRDSCGSPWTWCRRRMERRSGFGRRSARRGRWRPPTCRSSKR